MTIHHTLAWNHKQPRYFKNRKTATVLAVVVLSGILRLPAAQAPAALTLSQFLDLILARRAQATQPAPLSKVEEVFRKLLAAQGQEAAARQSLDRISGWSKVAQARLAAQNTGALDVEMLRFAETKVAAELAQLQAARQDALQEANRLLGRGADTPLVAIARTLPSSSPAAGLTPGETEQELASPQGATPETPGVPHRPDALESFQKEVLPQAQELLSKLYQNYLYGGVSLGTLLWQEQEVYRAELR